ncbi:MAG: hypothetical protein Q8M98_01315 [Candidatus Cloacimonadaceae bacterium]|nr:hypothetical protein [Candidatus Cloacimonadaceae bacterium]
MKFFKITLCLMLMLIFTIGTVHAAKAESTSGTKKLDLSRYHNVGNIWMRVSNYGFIGSGDDVVPQYPSLEYPGGSGIDYLYQGALWFGAKKYRRDDAGRKLYWRALNPGADSTGTIAQGVPGWQPWMKPVIDTLVTVGFDGDKDLYEFLPAYNPLLASNPQALDLYNMWNILDQIATASTRHQKRGIDDDGDGIIDEDFVGYTFLLRSATELPSQFQVFGSQFIANTHNYDIINEGFNSEIWFPLGFMDLSDRTYASYAFAAPHDDDGDGRIDEDGAPVSEQDFIAYYYDYCPFGTVGDRDLGQSRGGNRHYPLNVRIRQMSYQWSYDYIKNLVYVEFNITNMNIATHDTLFDCAMGIYMDADCGPQSMGPEKAADDVSGYVKGTGYEFAYTRDYDGDGGLTTGIVGARVCTPDPEVLQFHCWYWDVGAGPDDSNPYSFSYSPRRTANEKYWLLTGRNPNETKFTPLRPEQDDIPEFAQPSPMDTRFLFSFYGDMRGSTNPTDASWNLAPGRTMKIVVAVFPGNNKEDLKRTARWAKEIYGQAQTLTTVVLPDTFPHYNPPEPPEIPKLYAELMDDGNRIDLYWDNRSEFSYDSKTVSSAIIGWQNPASPVFKPMLDSDPTFVDWSNFPLEFQPRPEFPGWKYNMNALVNPYTGHRLRHDFQGYSVWARSGSGSQEDWVMIDRWDKIDTPVDIADYIVNVNSPHADSLFIDFGGYLGIDKNLPNRNAWNYPAEYTNFSYLNENYAYGLNPANVFYGYPIYNHSIDYNPAVLAQANAIAAANPNLPDNMIKILQARLFKHPQMRDDIYDELMDTKMIPLPGHGGQVAIPDANGDTSDLAKLKFKRLARRYYTATINYPRKGVEFYVAVTAYDRGIPSNDLNFLETGRDADANMKIFFPGALAKANMDNIYVVPNPYIGRSKFDGRRAGDNKGDKSRRIWFVNIPERCVIRIYTLAGDLVKEIQHDGAYQADIITVSKAAIKGISASGMRDWDLLSENRQIIAPGVYLYSIENKADKKIKVGKFVIIK